jgi:hypothetical protein
MCSILYKTYFQKYYIKLNRITGLDPGIIIYDEINCFYQFKFTFLSSI